MPGAQLLVRLGAMGDVLHALPAAASLKQSFPDRPLCWVVKERWRPLLEGNPDINEIVVFERNGLRSLWRSWNTLRRIRPAVAFDMQGLIQSALIARVSGAKEIWGFERRFLREPPAASLYTNTAATPGPHRIEKNLQLVKAAGAGLITDQSWIPEGRLEGVLPNEPFVLANPLAGWAGKQWPLRNYRELGLQLRKEGLTLVVNVPEQKAPEFQAEKAWLVHASSLHGLIYATRKAAAVVGVDSGPLHLAAALRKPGVALFGPTDPAANGPYGGTFTTLRMPGSEITYQRHTVIQPSMEAISCESVLQALMQQMHSSAMAVPAKPSTLPS